MSDDFPRDAGFLAGRREILLGGLALSAGVVAPRILAATEAAPIVTTTYGKVRGAIVEGGINKFLGIRYGAPPVGTLRFMPPQPPAKWTDIADATTYGHCAFQGKLDLGGAGTTPIGAALEKLQKFTIVGLAPGVTESEDCLSLNVWTPGTDKRRRPVMVWIHGGGFSVASGSIPFCDGVNLARKQDVVVVSVNHRLSALGYLYLAETMGSAYAKSGNVGMLDLVLSLEWVRDNIAAFGGDPTNVTIFGQSGGGAKVSTLLGMPSANGLFHKAIIESGAGIHSNTPAMANDAAKTILAELKIQPGDIASLQAVSAQRLISAAISTGTLGRLSPVVDKDVLPADPFNPLAPKQSAGVPILIGATKDETTLFTASQPWFGKLTEAELQQRVSKVLGSGTDAAIAAYHSVHPDYSPTYIFTGLQSLSWLIASIRLAELQLSQKAAPVWMYYMTWNIPAIDGVLKSPHATEVPLVFDNVEKVTAFLGNDAVAHRLADQMSSAWAAFARRGDPNTPKLPSWPAYDTTKRATMAFDVASHVVQDPAGSVIRAVGEAGHNPMTWMAAGR